MKTFDFELSVGFEYQHNGQLFESKFIKATAFTMRQLDKAAPVKEIVLKAMQRFSNSMSEDVQEEINEIAARQKENKQEKKKKKKKMGSPEGEPDESLGDVTDGKEMMAIIGMNCDKGDLVKLWLYMEKLLCSGICSIDDEAAFNGSHVKDLDPGDFEKLCGEYIGNFITS